MASGSDSPSGLDNTSSLEIALDLAIARRFAGVDEPSVQERSGMKRRNTPTARLHAVRPEMEHTPTEKLGRGTTALATTPSESSLMRPPARLRWKGIEVTDEFQEYAARVERGEELAPFRGPVLSRPSAEFPWTIAPRENQMLPPPQRPAPGERQAADADQRPSFAPQRPSLAPMAVSISTPPLSEPAVYPERGRAIKTALWLAGAVSSIVGALGVGAGATNTTGNEFDDLVPDLELAHRPAPAAAAAAAPRGEALASSPDDTIEASIGERQLDSLAANLGTATRLEPGAAAPAGATAPAALAAPAPAPRAGLAAPAAPLAAAALAAPAPAPTPTRSLTPRLFSAPPAALLPARPAAPTSAVAPSSTESAAPSASRLSIPPPGPMPAAGEIARGFVTTARPSDPNNGLSSSESPSLFSDRAPF